MEHPILQTIIISLVVGVLSFTLAKKLKIAPILFYLVAGVSLGPIGLNAVNPDSLGKGLPILIEIAVAIILFEGGLSLPPQGFKAIPLAIRKLLFYAIPLTGIGSTLLAHYVIGLTWKIAIIFGTFIVVTGPTVIGPLLKSIALTRKIDILLRFEAIWGDCIGVILSALALEFIQIKDTSLLGEIGLHFLSRILIGTLIGAGAGLILAKVILPWVSKLGDPGLPGMVALAIALGVFWESNQLTGSSGPLAVVVAGFSLAYLKSEALHDVRHFKDQIAMIFISTLFVLLSAAVNPMENLHLLPKMFIVAIIMGLFVRPLSVLFALANTEISLKEKLFISFIGPRGIIAIATASYASFILTGYNTEMVSLLTLTFIIIFLSGGVATLISRLLARILKVNVSEYESGIVFVGANKLSLAIASFIKEIVPIKFIDTNENNCVMVNKSGFDVHCDNALDDDVLGVLAEEGFKRALVMTPNDALNALILQHAQSHFGMNNSFRVAAKAENFTADSRLLSSRHIAFSSDFFYLQALERFSNGTDELKILTPDEANKYKATPLIEFIDKGIKIVRAEYKPERKTLYLCSKLPDEPVKANGNKQA